MWLSPEISPYRMRCSSASEILRGMEGMTAPVTRDACWIDDNIVRQIPRELRGRDDRRRGFAARARAGQHRTVVRQTHAAKSGANLDSFRRRRTVTRTTPLVVPERATCTWREHIVDNSDGAPSPCGVQNGDSGLFL